MQAFDGELNNTAINSMTDLTSCYKHRANFSSNYFFDRRQPGSVQLREEASSSPLLLGKEKAYFIETSGKLSLSWRQACALESFARYNKHVEVALLLVDPDNYRTGTPKTDRSFLIKLLTCNYGNINVIYQTAEELVKETVLQEWYHQSNWKSSPYKTAHLSDGIRLLVLFTLGGYYFDLDIIHIRPIENLRNFFTLQDRYQVCNAALHSEKEHPIIEQSLRDFVQNYKYITSTLYD